MRDLAFVTRDGADMEVLWSNFEEADDMYFVAKKKYTRLIRES